MTRRPLAQPKSTRYQTYLLTCWQERDETAATTTWRFRLETPRSGQQRLFANLTEVLTVIETELAGS